MSHPRERLTNKLLGYPDDARLLLVNADDLGMYQAINEAVGQAFAQGIVRSTSLMMPCPGAAQAVAMLRDHPALGVGVHLSVIRDIATYGWGPLAPKERVPSLLAADGLFYTTDRMAEMLARADLGELEVEFRAQVEAALSAGVAPTHLDWHCLHSGGRADVFEMTLGLALEYGVALRVASQPFIDQTQRRGLPTTDYDMLDSFRIAIETKPARYAAMLRELPPGLTEWAVHPSLGDAASRIIDPDGWRVRRTDFEVLIAPEIRAIIEHEGIILIGYGPLQAAWRGRSS